MAPATIWLHITSLRSEWLNEGKNEINDKKFEWLCRNVAMSSKQESISVGYIITLNYGKNIRVFLESLCALVT